MPSNKCTQLSIIGPTCHFEQNRSQSHGKHKILPVGFLLQKKKTNIVLLNLLIHVLETENRMGKSNNSTNARIQRDCNSSCAHSCGQLDLVYKMCNIASDFELFVSCL